MGSGTQRRSLLPKSHSKKELKRKKYVSFSPYARCLKMESQNLTDEEKSNMWWRKSDYDDFARVSRIISKAMLESGSEIWLKSKSLTSNEGSETECEIKVNRPRKTKDDTMIESLSSSSSILNAPLHHGFLSKNNSQEFYEMRNKWWHRFGHSRRGLEHIASNVEGKQRRLNARSAILSIMDEQQRQSIFLPKGYADVDKFRTIYLRESQWAGILARTAGESDADAVKKKFDESRRKPRDYFVKKHFDKKCENIATSNEIHLPIFMQDTIVSMQSSKKINLDSNTISQICFRNSKVMRLGSKLHVNKNSEGKPKTKTSNESGHCGSFTINEEKKSEANDDEAPTSLASAEYSSSSLAKIAASWGVDESQEDMSSLLKGVGISAQLNITVG